jgi:hypothetical protein
MATVDVHGRGQPHSVYHRSRHGRSGISLFFLGAVVPLEGAQEGEAPMSRHREFSDAALTELLRALRARSASRPDDPGLVASWPAVREDRMAAARTELRRRGHPVHRVPDTSASPGGTGHRWVVGVASEDAERAERDGTRRASCP